MGTFGGAHPIVLWVGVGKGHPYLLDLHKRIQDAVLSAGLPADLHAFRPHITLARPCGVSAAVLSTFLRAHAEHEFGMWEVKDFVLYSSRAESDGLHHTVELRQRLE